MPRFPSPQKTWQFIILVLAVAATVVVRMNRQTPSAPPESANRPRAAEHRAPQDTGAWQRLEGCVLVEGHNNDGDSFALRHGGQVFTFRLYFADCPEKYCNERNADRVADQGRYFGGLTTDETVAAGEAARDFTLRLLRRGPVTVQTQWEPVYDSERRYAFVTVNGEDLAEALVSRGLARIHTRGAPQPGGRSERDERSRLHELERRAKANHLGAWRR